MRDHEKIERFAMIGVIRIAALQKAGGINSADAQIMDKSQKDRIGIFRRSIDKCRDVAFCVEPGLNRLQNFGSNS
jgi:hypothetical protein